MLVSKRKVSMPSCINCKQTTTKKQVVIFRLNKISHAKCVKLVSKCAMWFPSLAALCPLLKNILSRLFKKFLFFLLGS